MFEFFYNWYSNIELANRCNAEIDPNDPRGYLTNQFNKIDLNTYQIELSLFEFIPVTPGAFLISKKELCPFIIICTGLYSTYLIPRSICNISSKKKRHHLTVINVLSKTYWVKRACRFIAPIQLLLSSLIIRCASCISLRVKKSYHDNWHP